MTAIALGASSPAAAQTWTWVGTANNANWHTASNWSPASVPPATADVVIGTGTGSVSIVSQNVQVATLTWSRPVTLGTGRTLRVTTATQRAQLTLESGASLTGGSYAVQLGAIIGPAFPALATIDDVAFTSTATISSGSVLLRARTLASRLLVGGNTVLWMPPGSEISNEIRQTLTAAPVQILVNAPGSVTIRPSGQLIGSFTIGGSGFISLRNEGLVRMLQSNHVFETGSNVTFNNAGSVRVDLGQFRTLGAFSNLSTGVVSTASNLERPISFQGATNLAMGTFTAAGVEILGDVDLGGSTFAPSAFLVYLEGTLRNGSLNLGTGAIINTPRVTDAPIPTLRDITLAGETRLVSGLNLSLDNVTGTGLRIVGTGGTWTGVLRFVQGVVNVPIRTEAENTDLWLIASGGSSSPLTIAQGVTMVFNSPVLFARRVQNLGSIAVNSAKIVTFTELENSGTVSVASGIAGNIRIGGRLSGTGTIVAPAGTVTVSDATSLPSLGMISADRLNFGLSGEVPLTGLPGGVLTLRCRIFAPAVPLRGGTIEFASGSGLIQGTTGTSSTATCAEFIDTVLRGDIRFAGRVNLSRNVTLTGQLGAFADATLVLPANTVLTSPIDASGFTLTLMLSSAETLTIASGVEVRASTLILGGTACGSAAPLTLINRGTITLSSSGDALQLSVASVQEYGVLNAPNGRVSVAGNITPGQFFVNAARILLIGPIDLQGQTLDLATLGYTLSGNISNGRLILGPESLNVAPMLPPASQTFTNMTIDGTLRVRPSGMSFVSCTINAPVSFEGPCVDMSVSHNTRFLAPITGSTTCGILMRVTSVGELVLGPEPVTAVRLQIVRGPSLPVSPESSLTLTGSVTINRTPTFTEGSFSTDFDTAVSGSLVAASGASFRTLRPSLGVIETPVVSLTEGFTVTARPELRVGSLSIARGGIDLGGSSWRPTMPRVNVTSGPIRNGRLLAGTTEFHILSVTCGTPVSLSNIVIEERMRVRAGLQTGLSIDSTASLPGGFEIIGGDSLWLLYPSESQPGAPGEVPDIRFAGNQFEVVLLACSRNIVLPAGRQIAGGRLALDRGGVSTCFESCASTLTVEGTLSHASATAAFPAASTLTIINRGTIEVAGGSATFNGPFRNDGVVRTRDSGTATISSLDPLSTGRFEASGDAISFSGGLATLGAPASFSGNIRIGGSTNLQGATFKVPRSDVRIVSTISNGTLDVRDTNATFGSACGTPATLSGVSVLGDIKLRGGRLRLANSTVNGSITSSGPGISQIELDSDWIFNGIIAATENSTLHIGALRIATLRLGTAAWLRGGNIIASMPPCQAGQVLTIVNSGVIEAHTPTGSINLPSTTSGSGPRWGPTRVGAIDDSVAFAFAAPTNRAHFAGSRAVSSVPTAQLLEFRSLYLQDGSRFGLSQGEVLRLENGSGTLRSSTQAMLDLHGRVEGSIENLGLLSLPSTAVAEVSGSFVQSARLSPFGTVRARLDGSSGGIAARRLNIAGTASIDGVIDVVIDPGSSLWTPAVGSSFDLLNAAGGLTLRPGFQVRALMTAQGAAALGLSLPAAAARVPADTEPLVVLPDLTLLPTVVDGTTLRLEARRASCAIVSAPPAATGCFGVPVVLASSVNGTFAAVRWQVQSVGGDWTDLIDGPTAGVGVVSGASATTLRIERLAASAAVRVVYTTACGLLPSEPVLITRISGCSVADIANVDGETAADGVCPDGVLTNADFTAFVAAFFASPDDPRREAADIADTDGFPSAEGGPDGYVDNGDFTAFFHAYFDGC